MRRQGWVGTGIAAVMAVSLMAATANAQSVTTERQTVTTPAAAPAPAPAAASTTVVQPVQQPVAVAPAPSPITKNKEVITETHSESYMFTIAKDTFFGAVAGAIVGGAIYFLDRNDIRPVDVAYWASGGALVGAAVGVVEISVNESRNERATSYLFNGGKRDIAFVPRLVNVHF